MSGIFLALIGTTDKLIIISDSSFSGAPISDLAFGG
jgi:hypothetical protein